ncbi:hypothetical protein NLI96_g6334 [Meripilus lineatus]|uniref:Uncharacterized protein n=1 Tax=Meripilus lineatus TaxID=2056292 RepID=A0AAD5YDZ9_9APHY|nr:hypothetical protein NLI96_g6334 [Physisporinus lineatus]
MQLRYPSSPPLAFLQASDVDPSWSTVASVLLQDIRAQQSTINPEPARGHIRSDEDLAFEFFEQEANRLYDAVPDAILARSLRAAPEFPSAPSGERDQEEEGSITSVEGDYLRPLSPRSFMDT